MANSVGAVGAEAPPLRSGVVHLHRLGPAEGAGGVGVGGPGSQVPGAGGCRGPIPAVAGVGAGAGGGTGVRGRCGAS